MNWLDSICSIHLWPRWFLQRLELETGISASWWLVTLWAAAAGAASAVVVVTVVRAWIVARKQQVTKRVESRIEDER